MDRHQPYPAHQRLAVGEGRLASEPDNGAYKITDVIVEGISMAVTQRSEFAAVIQRHGGQVEGLLALLRQKTANAAARP